MASQREVDGCFAHHDAFVTYPLSGHLTLQHFPSLADMIASQGVRGTCSRILLDWSEVVSWDFQKPGGRQLDAWRDGTSRIDRLAILHGSAGNRPAALLGAILREKGCEVRSYRVDGRMQAVLWLIEATPVGGRPTR